MNDFEQFYQDNHRPFGEEPAKIVSDILKYTNSGTVLDIGAGDGRNAIFLASKGFEVTAQDISQTGIDILKQRALNDGLKISTIVGDAAEMEFDKQYDVILNIVLLHFLSRPQALSLIGKMQSHTKLGGYNAIIAFSQNGDFFTNHPELPNFFAEPDELLKIYKGWEILAYSEIETKANQMKNFDQRLLARKI